MIFVGDWSIFKTFSRFLAFSCMKMDLDVFDLLGSDCYDLRSLGLDERIILVLEKHKRT